MSLPIAMIGESIYSKYYFSEIVVAELSGVPTPFKVVSYSVIDNNIPRNVTECTNLYTDAEVDYGEICSAKYINLL